VLDDELVIVAGTAAVNMTVVVDIVPVECKIRVPHHAEGLANPKVLAQKKVTDFGYPRACRFRKYQNLNRSPGLLLPTFFKT
jgi:hypothetical protein